MDVCQVTVQRAYDMLSIHNSSQGLAANAADFVISQQQQEMIMNVAVPAEMGADRQLYVKTPAGLMAVAVPAGVDVGQTFPNRFAVPAPSAAPAVGQADGQYSLR